MEIYRAYLRGFTLARLHQPTTDALPVNMAEATAFSLGVADGSDPSKTPGALVDACKRVSAQLLITRDDAAAAIEGAKQAAEALKKLNGGGNAAKN
ncbi:MAG: hypothetical protein EKK55_21955 [Rhodocyclaceae bacterium]|nr:MAG: hypothetical protein EKK55_21955 [Rhodocyclaceae bacterium]